MDLGIALNTLATEVFRNQADHDYIAARSSYRLGLREQFLWSALQSLEKYFKAILLFNGRSARREHIRNPPKRDFGHDLVRLNSAVQQVPGLTLDFPNWLPDFLAYLTTFGNNRYLTKSTYTVGRELARLDEAVWSIRRYAQHMRSAIGTRRAPSRRLLEAHLRYLNAPEHRKRPQRLHPFTGFLEDVLRRPRSDLTRQALIWNNLFYGGRVRYRVRYRQLSTSVIPPQERRWCKEPRLRRRLSRYVKL